VADFEAISKNLQAGKAQEVQELVQAALEEGVTAREILDQALMPGMGIIGEKFKRNEVYVPEVLIAARAMNAGTELLRPYFISEDIQPVGRAVIGTVKGDLHDIGKNLVKMMMEGKGIEITDLGTDVAAETFAERAGELEADFLCCSALLTTTMKAMEEVVKAVEAAGLRERVTIMIGGAPVTEAFRESIGADLYSDNAAGAAEAAIAALGARQ
jgi:methanogenic corrinoid protein MtbC1